MHSKTDSLACIARESAPTVTDCRCLLRWSINLESITWVTPLYPDHLFVDFGAKSSQSCVYVLCRRSVQRCKKYCRAQLPEMWNVCRVCVCSRLWECARCMRPYMSVLEKEREKVDASSPCWSPENMHEVRTRHTHTYSRKGKRSSRIVTRPHKTVTFFSAVLRVWRSPLLSRRLWPSEGCWGRGGTFLSLLRSLFGEFAYDSNQSSVLVLQPLVVRSQVSQNLRDRHAIVISWELHFALL